MELFQLNSVKVLGLYVSWGRAYNKNPITMEDLFALNIKNRNLDCMFFEQGVTCTT